MHLEIDNIVKDYRGRVRANDGISLSIDRGEVFGLLGPNGAGKTTLVSQIVALIAPTSGTIEIGGVDVVADPAHARKACSYQPQGDVPLDGFTPTQAIEIVGRLRGGDSRNVRKRTQELIETLEISEWAHKGGSSLSGGVRRLVGYCMAVVTPGDIVILDEPTNDVDPLRRRLLWNHIRQLADSGTTVILVTHNVMEAERSMDRLAIIDKWRVQGAGTPASLKGNRANDLRLELVLEPHSEVPEVPDFINAVTVGRRLRAAVSNETMSLALEWARDMKDLGFAEEFSISPTSLEDVYVQMIGRPDALGEDEPTQVIAA